MNDPNHVKDTKTCSACNTSLPFTSFTKDSSKKDGLTNRCRKCAKEYWQKYKENNLEKLSTRSQQNRNSRALSNIKRRAKKKGIAFDLEIKDIEGVDVCPVFGFELERAVGSASKRSPSVDRINPTKGYTKDNIQIISNKANTMKQDATPEELLMFADWIYRTYKK